MTQNASLRTKEGELGTSQLYYLALTNLHLSRDTDLRVFISTSPPAGNILKADSCEFV